MASTRKSSPSQKRPKASSTPLGLGPSRGLSPEQAKVLYDLNELKWADRRASAGKSGAGDGVESEIAPPSQGPDES